VGRGGGLRAETLQTIKAADRAGCVKSGGYARVIVAAGAFEYVV
jgi:hypothetical protein